MSSFSLSYERLTEGDLEVSDDDPPSIRAARNPNPLVLPAVLNEGLRLAHSLGPNAPPFQHFHVNRNFTANTYISGAIHGIYTSPLVTAISACLPQNVTTLLASGADPNGIRLSDLDEYSVRFIRGRNSEYNTYSFVMCPPRAKAMPATVINQTAPLTVDEIAMRRKVFSRFWSEPELPTLRFRSLPARTALETAASVGDITLFDHVCAAGPDHSWWTINPTAPQLPDNLTHSALCTSSPCHEAIISRKPDLLRHLLSLGYSPNIFPLAAPTCCLPPHIAAIVFCNPPNLEAYDILARHPTTDLTLRTPVFSLHVLHFATARLDIPLLQHILRNPNTPLEEAGTTALGHSLLHIATLPLTDTHVNLFSPKIFYSVHDVRTLDTKRWLPTDLGRRNPANRGIFFAIADTLPFPHVATPEDVDDALRQAETVMWLLESGTQNLDARDVYGNTPLHYLVSAMWVNEELVRRVRALEGGEAVWKESRNELGYTPEELQVDGEAAEREQWKSFWMEG